MEEHHSLGHLFLTLALFNISVREISEAQQNSLSGIIRSFLVDIIFRLVHHIMDRPQGTIVKLLTMSRNSLHQGSESVGVCDTWSNQSNATKSDMNSRS